MWTLTPSIRGGIRYAETQLSDLICQNDCQALEFKCVRISTNRLKPEIAVSTLTSTIISTPSTTISTPYFPAFSTLRYVSSPFPVCRSQFRQNIPVYTATHLIESYSVSVLYLTLSGATPFPFCLRFHLIIHTRGLLVFKV